MQQGFGKPNEILLLSNPSRSLVLLLFHLEDALRCFSRGIIHPSHTSVTFVIQPRALQRILTHDKVAHAPKDACILSIPYKDDTFSLPYPVSYARILRTLRELRKRVYVWGLSRRYLFLGIEFYIPRFVGCELIAVVGKVHR